MARSRALLVAVVALGACALACDSLLGLGKYQEVDCVGDCGQGSGSPEGGDDASEGGLDTWTPDVAEGGLTPDASDGDAPDTSPVSDGAIGDGPPLTELWARWHMPNPDASSAPGVDGAGPLPNPTAYIDGAVASTVFDVITGLTWSTTSSPATDFAHASGACAAMGTGWHVPTRIELVSLVDFTQPFGSPTIDPVAFPSTQTAKYWTSSQVPGDGSTIYWTVDFSNGLAQQWPSASAVRCVKGGP